MKVLADIKRQPKELIKSLEYQLSEGQGAFAKAAALLESPGRLLIVGIGASHHAGLALKYIFEHHQINCQVIDASELLYFYSLEKGDTLLLLSRSGKSIEIVKSAQKANTTGANIISITNDLDSPLAQLSDIALPIHADFDHNISITMYTGIILVGALLATQLRDTTLFKNTAATFKKVLQTIDLQLAQWQKEITNHTWINTSAYTQFLARGSSFGSAKGAELLWQEAAKSVAGAMPTGSFIHGPQEILKKPLRFCIWLDHEHGRAYDLQLINDLLQLKQEVMVIGHQIPQINGVLSIDLPYIAAPFQAIIDVIPVQLAAVLYADKIGEDASSFLYCNYIVQAEGGIL